MTPSQLEFIHTVPRKLALLRFLSGMSQREVGEKSGVGEKTYWTFESGERIWSIKYVQLMAIVEAMGMSSPEFEAWRPPVSQYRDAGLLSHHNRHVRSPAARTTRGEIPITIGKRIREWIMPSIEGLT